MNVFGLSNRVDDLSKKLGDKPKERIARIDICSFTDAERALFRKIEQLQEQYGTHLNPEVLEANKDLIFKQEEIFFHYAVDTFRFAMLCFWGNPESQRDKNLFNTFFYNFLLETKKCLKEVHETKTDEEYFDLMDKYDFFGKLSHLVDKPLAEMEKQEKTLEKTEYSEDEDNEHYDRV